MEEFDTQEHQANDIISHNESKLLDTDISSRIRDIFEGMEAGQNLGVFPFGYFPHNTI